MREVKAGRGISAQRVFGLLRENVGLVLASCFVLLPIALFTTVFAFGIAIGIGTMSLLVKSLLQSARQSATGRPSKVGGSRWATGGYAFASLVLLLAAMALAANVSMHFIDASAQPTVVGLAITWTSAVAASAGVGAALGPLLFTPFCCADAVSVVRAPSDSLRIAAERGAGSSALLGAVAGLATGFPIGLAWIFFFSLSDTEAFMSALIAVPAGAAVGVPVTTAMLAAAYANKEETERPEPVDIVSRRVRALGGLLVPLLAGLLAVTAITMFTPAPMRPVTATMSRGIPSAGVATRAGVVRLGDHGVTVRVVGDGLMVEAPDGGGAGEIPAGYPVADAVFLEVGRRGAEGTAGAYQVLLSDYSPQPLLGNRRHRTVMTLLNEDGVRLDDSFTDRITRRLGRPGMAAMGVGLLFLAILIFVVGSSLGEARALTAMSFSDPAPSKNLRGLEGVLRVGSDTTASYRRAGLFKRLTGFVGGEVSVEGEAWVEAESGVFRLRLPDRPIPVLGTAKPDNWDRASVVVLSQFANVASMGLRSASSPLPDDARLVLGVRGDATRELAGQAVRLGSRIAVVVLAALSGAFVQLILALI